MVLVFYLANEWSPFRGHIGEKIKKKKKDRVGVGYYHTVTY